MQDIVSALDDPSLDFGFTFTEAVEFLPGHPPVAMDEYNRRTLNLWKAPEWAGQGDAEPTLFLNHIAYLFDGDGIAIQHVLDFIAHLVQRPEQRINHALLLTSEAKGIGKSTLELLVRRLVEEQPSGVAQSKDLKSQFDGWLIGKLLIQVDEIYEYGNWDLANKLKSFLTEPTVSVNMKYDPQMIVKNYARFIIFSNHVAPFDLEDGDRRYFVHHSKARPKEPSYYDALNAYIGHMEGLNQIYSWLNRGGISSFRPFAPPPMTEAKQALIDVSGNPLRGYLKESVQSGHLLETCGPEFSLDTLERQLVEDGYGAHAKNSRELAKAIEEAGITKKRKKTKDGQRPNIYCLLDSDQFVGGPSKWEF